MEGTIWPIELMSANLVPHLLQCPANLFFQVLVECRDRILFSPYTEFHAMPHFKKVDFLVSLLPFAMYIHSVTAGS